MLIIFSRWIFRFCVTETGSYIFTSYAATFYYNYIYNMGMLFFCTSNSLLEIFTLLDRLFLVKRIVRCKLSPRAVLAITLAISCLGSFAYIPLIDIVELNKSAYANRGSSFYKTSAGKVLYLILFVYKNVALVIISFILYLITSFECIKFYNKKKALAKSGRKSEQKAQFIQMTIIMFGLFLLGNVSISLVGVCSQFNQTCIFVNYLRVINHMMIHLTTTFNIFIFYKTNTRYRQVFLDLFNKKIQNVSN